MRVAKKMLTALLICSFLMVSFVSFGDEKVGGDADIRFFIDSSVCIVNGLPVVMDTVPTIRNSRTLLPIRYVVTPLGAAVGWDGSERKVTVGLADINIEMWIDNPVARVNGGDVPIDGNDANVKPIIIDDRTMLPVRFVSEQLKCRVDWDGLTRQVQIAKGDSITLMSENGAAEVPPASQDVAVQTGSDQSGQGESTIPDQPLAEQPASGQSQGGQMGSPSLTEDTIPSNQPSDGQPLDGQPVQNDDSSQTQQDQVGQQGQGNGVSQGMGKDENSGFHLVGGTKPIEESVFGRRIAATASNQSDNPAFEKLFDNYGVDQGGNSSGNKPVGSKPDSNKPVGSKPDSNKPVSNKPISNKPVSNKPISNKPVSNKPVSNKPVGTVDNLLPSVTDNTNSTAELVELVNDFPADFAQSDWSSAPKRMAIAVKTSEADLPIVMRLGRGYDVFGKYASVDSLKQPVLDITKLVRDNRVERMRLDSGENYQTAEQTIKKFSKLMSNKAKVGGDFLFFGGSVSNNFSSGRTSELETYFSTYTYLVKKYDVYVKAGTDLKDYLLPEVKRALKEESPEYIFGNYGYYVLVDSITGGRVDHSISAKADQSTSFENFKLAASADFRTVLFGTTGASAGRGSVQNRSRYEASREETLISQGGARTLNIRQLQGDNKALRNWEATLEDHGTLVEFGETRATALVPIWELCTPAKRIELKRAFAAINASQSEVRRWPSELYIGDIQFVFGATAVKARQKCPVSDDPDFPYMLIDRNLNHGVGGNYIYLCYRMTDDPAEAITDLFAEYDGSETGGKNKAKAVTLLLTHNQNQANFTRNPLDLNRNVHFWGNDDLVKRICLWTTKDATRTPLKSIDVVFSRRLGIEYEEWSPLTLRNNPSTPANMNAEFDSHNIIIAYQR